MIVAGDLAAPDLGADATAAAKSAAARSRAEAFREETREQRMRIAQEAEHRFGRKVSWAVSVDGEPFPFTTLSIPVMTRLRLRERKVLDTLVDAGVARSRSDALAWCVQARRRSPGRLDRAAARCARARRGSAFHGPEAGFDHRLIGSRLVSSGDDGRRVRWHSA